MNIFIDFLKVFVCGGLLCVIAQIIIDKTKFTPARILVGFVVSGVVLTAFGLYEPFVDFAKSGATVPLSGFGYALAKGVQRAVAEKGLLGILTGGLAATAAGISAVILFAGSFALIFSSKEK
ncbi:MAG: stage V sporulation protein AE [Oscillospiraceae bacterium]|nr:stage V sporulation protein AE [Oscillospiraceae bacterium]